jgi:signal transduction histidine kinase
MGIAHRKLVPPSWLRLPHRTARLRLTALCGGLFLLSGVALVAITYVLFEQATQYRSPHLPKVPHASAIARVRLLGPSANGPPPGSSAPFLQRQHPLAEAQRTLGQAQQELFQARSVGSGVFPLGQVQRRLKQAQDQLTQGQHQLTQGQRRLADAVHQLAHAESAQAGLRAADSHQLLVNSGIALAVVAVLAVLAGWLVAGRMLRPIRIITRTARRISSTSLHERLALDGPEDELKELGDTLDDLFGRLDAAFDAQRNFVANAAHELRTPLTTERTLLQVALDDPQTSNAAWRSTAREVLASSDEQERLIEALLTLASSEGGLEGRESVDLAATVTATLSDLQPEVDRRGVHIREAMTPAPLEGDPLLVERLVANLLTNAVRHNLVDGRVEVMTGVKEGRAVLSVTNTGPLIPTTEVDRLFQPFQRLDPRRAHHKDGHGLGLSIVRAIATAHQASISAHSMPDGGLSVSVTFPQPTTPHDATPIPSHGDGRSTDIPIATTGSVRGFV